jgi:hypothetical protein
MLYDNSNMKQGYNQNQGSPNPSKDSHGPWSPPTDYTFKPSRRNDGCDESGPLGMFLGIFYFPILFLGIGFLLLLWRYSDSCPPGLKPKAKTSVTTPS